MRFLFLFSLASLSILASYSLSHAQYYSSNRAASERIDRLERDLQILQRQVSRGEPVPSDAEYTTDGASSIAQASQLEETLRRLNGEIERLEHENETLKASLERQAKDMDFRLKALEDKVATLTATPATQVPVPEASSGPSTGDGEAVADDDAGAPSGNEEYGSAREHYNAAFRLLNQAQYDEAGVAFESFVKTYPKDPLAGNAYYWLGETYYVRGDYTQAADKFRQGFETAPKGPKAADNLLKLGMALSAMKRTKEACVVFKQIGVKYPDSAPSARSKAAQEATRLGCQ